MTRSCVRCGDPIPEGSRSDRRLCSRRCVVHAHLDRRREAHDLLRRMVDALDARDLRAVQDAADEARALLRTA